MQHNATYHAIQQKELKIINFIIRNAKPAARWYLHEGALRAKCDLALNSYVASVRVSIPFLRSYGVHMKEVLLCILHQTL